MHLTLKLVTFTQPIDVFVVIEYKIIYILNLVIVCYLQVTPTWFSRDDVIAMHSILVNAILHTLYMLDFTNTSWVVDLGDVISDEGSTSTQFVMFQHFVEVAKLGSWCYMPANVQQKY